jgi:hypothetical protein
MELFAQVERRGIGCPRQSLFLFFAHSAEARSSRKLFVEKREERDHRAPGQIRSPCAAATIGHRWKSSARLPGGRAVLLVARCVRPWVRIAERPVEAGHGLASDRPPSSPKPPGSTGAIRRIARGFSRSGCDFVPRRLVRRQSNAIHPVVRVAMEPILPPADPRRK